MNDVVPPGQQARGLVSEERMRPVMDCEVWSPDPDGAGDIACEEPATFWALVRGPDGEESEHFWCFSHARAQSIFLGIQGKWFVKTELL
jgi:hypothetical protein